MMAKKARQRISYGLFVLPVLHCLGLPQTPHRALRVNGRVVDWEGSPTPYTSSESEYVLLTLLFATVLEAPNSSPGGHRLGVNGLAVDRDNAIL